MRFLHCADLHIGKYQAVGGERYWDFLRAFERIAGVAQERNVDFIVAAGDIFDLKALSPRTMREATATLARLKKLGVPLYAIEGNHDRAYAGESGSWLYYLNELGLLRLLRQDYDEGEIALRPYDGHTGAYADEEGCRIYGLGYMGAATARHLIRAGELIERVNKPCVVMLHAGLSEYLPQDMAKLTAKDIEGISAKADYIALGHIHKRYEEGRAANPGSSEFTDVAEARRGDVKGVFIVDIDGGVRREFVELETRRHEFFSFEAGDCASLPGVLRDGLYGRGLQGAVVEISAAVKTGVSLDVLGLEREIAEATGALEAHIAISQPAPAGASMISSDMAGLEDMTVRGEIAALGYEGARLEQFFELAQSARDRELNVEECVKMAINAAKGMGL